MPRSLDNKYKKNPEYLTMTNENYTHQLDILSGYKKINYCCDDINKLITDIHQYTHITDLILDTKDIKTEVDFSQLLNLEVLILNCILAPINTRSNSNLLHLEIKNHNFNFPLDLTHNTKLNVLRLTYNYNHPLDLSKCIELKELHIGGSFEQELDLSQNINLEYFSNESFHSIYVDLSHMLKLRKLYLHVADYCIDNILPSGLQELIIGPSYNYPLDNLPNGLKILTFIWSKFNQEFYNHDLNMLPDSVEDISFPANFNGTISKLPKNIKKIRVDVKYKEMIDKIIAADNNLTGIDLKTFSFEEYKNAIMRCCVM